MMWRANICNKKLTTQHQLVQFHSKPMSKISQFQGGREYLDIYIH